MDESPADQDRDLSKAPPISGGQSGRPRDETIGRTGRGLPNDTGRPVEIDEDEAARIERKLRDLSGPSVQGVAARDPLARRQVPADLE